MANPFAETWEELRARETVDAARRIFAFWDAAATPFYVFVLRPPSALAHRVVEIEQPLIAAGIGHCIPRDFLHVTVQSLGNIGDGELTEQIVDDCADAVATTLAGMPPFAVRLRGAGSFGPAAFVAVHEDDARMPLQRMQRAVVETLVATDRVPVRHPDRAYVPHLSICYYDRAYPAGDVIGALEPQRHTDIGVMIVGAIEVVRVVGNGEPYPPMEMVRRIPLGGGV